MLKKQKLIAQTVFILSSCLFFFIPITQSEAETSVDEKTIIELLNSYKLPTENLIKPLLDLCNQSGIPVCEQRVHQLAKTQGTFTGRMNGHTKGNGDLSGPLTLTITGNSVSGNVTGQSSTGDSFGAKITGTIDLWTGQMNATYSGLFNIVVNGKPFDTIEINGPFTGNMNHKPMTGTWGEGKFGSWNAAATTEPVLQHIKVSKPENCADTEGYFYNYTKENNYPAGITMTKLLFMSYEQIRRIEKIQQDNTNQLTPEEIWQMSKELEKYQQIHQLMTNLINQKESCAKDAVKGIK